MAPALGSPNDRIARSPNHSQAKCLDAVVETGVPHSTVGWEFKFAATAN